VHCLREQVSGMWQFHLGPASSERSSCGHKTPDVASEYVEPKSFLEVVDKVLSIDLQMPNKAVLNGSAGTWTMIYDEGFEVRVGGKRYLAFSRYDTDDETGVTTNFCGETMSGWYHDDDGSNWGCYYGVKSTPVPPTNFSTEAEHSNVNLHDSPMLVQQTVYQGDDDLVQWLNTQQLSWKSKVYPQFVGKSLRSLVHMAGHRRQVSLNPRNILKKLLRTASLALARIMSASLPTNFDWRDVNGQNFLPPIRNQGDCGSCYVMASMNMLSSRVRIATKNEDKVVLSPQRVLACSFYNQGCDGGYPFLVGKYSYDFELVPESCAPYKDDPSSFQCSDACDINSLDTIYRVSDYRYVGGFYGAATEEEMMRELYKNGPIVVSFEPTYEFMHYESGIYKNSPIPEHMRKDTYLQWEKVGHSVLAVGWGEENGEKYWIVMNTWGEDWGEGGFFRIRRGTDEAGIESIAVAMDPVIVKQNK